MAIVAAMIIALALVWPQGIGARSPGPFGHMPVQQTPEMQAAMKRQTEASQQRINQARETMRGMQAEAIAAQP